MSFEKSPLNRRTLLKVGAVTPFAAAGVGALGMGLALADDSPAPSGGDTAVVDRDLKHTDTVHTHGATDKNPELDGTPAKHVAGYITMAAASWPADLDSPDVVEFQGKDLNTGEWGDWLSAELMTDIEENASEAVWVGPSSAVNVRAFRDGIDISEQLTAHLITTSESRSDVRLASSGSGSGITRILPATVTPGTGAPTFITREEWNAGTVNTSRLSYAKELKAICIHHTGGSNTYTAAQSPQVVRGMFTYHTKILGWADLGYNVVVDKYGQIFEGRAGGLHRNVAGAHARGFNTGSCGISVMGDYMDIPVPTAALNAIATVAAWKLASTFTQDVYGTETWTVTTSNVKRSGTFSMPHLFAHRDVNYTDCPGDTYYGQLPKLRSLVQQKLNGFKERYPEHLVAYVNGGGRGAFGTVTHVRRAEGAYDVTRLTGGLILTAGGRTSAHKSAFGADWTSAWGRPLESTTGTTQRFENGTATKVNGKVSFTPGGTRTKHFIDVPDNLTFAHEINTLADLGVIRGWPDRTFRPQISVWRDAVIAYMYRIAGEPAYTPPRRSPFLDVDQSQPFYKEICWAHSTGLTTGWKVRGGWEFRPYQPILRDAMAAFLFRASGENLSNVQFSGFKDVNSSLVFEKEIKWMGSTGISRGWDDGTYRPFNQTTRAELAAFLYRYMEHRGLL
ncbi:S-layer homology domain-containing protein [Dermabacter hominis]|uniref:S-layer homology domain-containing protein n=1 Tax=Dermabacter hominis TaxID=36740 RepID=UPI000C77D595|nr:S-layer homology domain-containing protein [Dermabacter hominis]MCT1808113.1 S-layer homology domain-containing protein [Dermabacter hominis]WIK61391.1 S-layer homology domain-containing protein [Dermabacter hominis]